MSDSSRRPSPPPSPQPSATPDGWGSVRPPDSARSKPRKRVTLRFDGPSLGLPTDLSPATEGDEDAGTGELALPLDYIPSTPPERASSAPPPDVRDGWQRNTASLPPRPRSERPPPNIPEESTDSLRLVSARGRSLTPDATTEMLDRFALGDFTGALRAAELILGRSPSHAEAQRVASASEQKLVSFHLARLGSASTVLAVRVANNEVRWLGLDHRAGFLLSLVDGTTTVDELVDLSGMKRHEALRLLAELLDVGAVERAR